MYLIRRTDLMAIFVFMIQITPGQPFLPLPTLPALYTVSMSSTTTSDHRMQLVRQNLALMHSANFVKLKFMVVTQQECMVQTVPSLVLTLTVVIVT